MEKAPKDLVNEILALSNTNLLLREQIARLQLEVERLQKLANAKGPSDARDTTAPMEKL